MKLSEKQQIFTENIAKLIIYSYNYGIRLTFGEAQRPKDMQYLYYYGFSIEHKNDGIFLNKSKKKSKTLKSKHIDRLAVDFNFFVSGKLTYDRNKIQPLGDYWESLHPDNQWGGNWVSFVDTPHFQMN